MPALPNVHVIGANVDGLTTAVLLLQQGYRVTLVANAFPGDKDYQPGWFNTHWQTSATASDTITQPEDDLTSFRMLWKLAQVKAKEAGLTIISAEHIDESNPPDHHHFSGPWWKNAVPSFHWMPKHHLPEDVQQAYNYTTVLIRPARYLVWLQAQFLTLGGRRKRVTLDKLMDVAKENDQLMMVVNCCPNLDPPFSKTQPSDEMVQQWTIRASQIRKALHIKRQNQDLYLTPQMNGTVLVGAKGSASFATVHDLLHQLKRYCPELSWGKGVSDKDVVSAQPDVTPTQHRCSRVENQYLVTPLGTKISVTHNYGHQGYQSSWGASKRVVQLVNDAYTHLQHEPKAITRLLSRL
ncbi:hypothetical protein DM01DRAFT_1381262 [Hesseltinella vesiculosa]|uniref:FAD dependent oxidoreductase domain-containing protein n=1 Tax=Hesseltinella vesiculosa TaxID=101127 RepID=A0A1X2GRI5_9FUNG|nr:hypothetical protein DM01DRAFT_1381262 [Hesseltinella vesiculosa]